MNNFSRRHENLSWSASRGEFAENSDRKDFLPSEIEAIRRALEPVEKAAAKERQAKAGPSDGRGAKPTASGNFPQPFEGRTRDRVGASAGVSGRSVEKIAKVVQAAEREPERFAPLVAEMDRTGQGMPESYRNIKSRLYTRSVKPVVPAPLTDQPIA